MAYAARQVVAAVRLRVVLEVLATERGMMDAMAVPEAARLQSRIAP